VTTTVDAARRYRIGVEQLLAGDIRALTTFDEAVHRDPWFAVAHAAGAAVAVAAGGCPWPRLAAARLTARQATRRERQQVEVIAAALGDDAVRAVALGVDHLSEFPADVLALHVLDGVIRRIGDSDLHTQLERTLESALSWAASTDCGS
jgi:hypothetical protein